MSRARDIADSAATINLLDGVAAGTITNSKAAIYGASGEVNATTLQVAGAAITSSVAELNVLDGIPAGLTATEIGYVDGVTSAIQTQLNAKGTGTVSNLGDLSITSTSTEINKLDALSRGSILYGNSSGATTVLTKGTNEQVLTSDGTDIAWADAGGGGGWVLLGSSTASGALTISLTSVMSDTYYDYVVEGGLDTDSTYPNPLGFEFIKSGGSYQTSEYSVAYWGAEWKNTVNQDFGSSSYYNLSGSYLTNGPMYLRLHIARPQTSAGGNAYIYVQAECNGLYSTPARAILSTGGVSSANDYTGIRIKDYRSGPAQLTGTLRIWGRATS